MKKTIARALWIFTITTFAATACKSDKSAVQANESLATGVEMSKQLQYEEGAVTGEAYDMAENTPSPDPASAVARTSHDSKANYGAPKGRLAGQVASPVPSAPPPQVVVADPRSNTEAFKDYGTNPMIDTSVDHLSTFAVDVDTASYAIARRKIIEGQTPPPSSVRVEEFVNYFKYDYAGPKGDMPFAVHMDMAPSPFTTGRQILRVGVQAKKLSLQERKNANLVFLVDVSGSMSSADKLPLAKRAMRVLVDNLKDGDTVSLVTYAGNTRVVLEPTGLEHKAQILSALEDLSSGGSTAMSSGMDLAYDLAAKSLGPNSVSRVIVLSDGDANVGNTNHDQILKAIAGKVKEGVTMSTIGFGMGNYQDERMEQLANKGNGNYYYIDTLNQARRIFQEQLGGTLEVVAKDVKIQVNFDEDAVKSYRLIGYENRDIADKDFRDDKVDAGEIGAGHSVTALYEVELTKADAVPVTVLLRHKKPRGTKAIETSYAFNLDNAYKTFDGAPGDFRFASAVMASAEILRKSEHAQGWRFDKVLALARNASDKESAERKEFIKVMTKASASWTNSDS
jgi:Ca-activated chloride channel family protein